MDVLHQHLALSDLRDAAQLLELVAGFLGERAAVQGPVHLAAGIAQVVSGDVGGQVIDPFRGILTA